MHRRGILNVMGGQNQVNVTKGYQVQIFKKGMFELLCRHIKTLWVSCHHGGSEMEEFS